ncbi:MAG: selenium-dependent molybdenum cofactor biosynthesis protein YqeB [Chloroflexota bacterium]
MALFDTLILIRGAGDLGSGVAYRLFKAGFPIAMTELAHPLLVRTTVSYGACVHNGGVIVGGVAARRVSYAQVPEMIMHDVISVIVDSSREAIAALRPTVVIDARVAKVNLDTTLQDAPLVIALGPGFTAGVDCHAVIETNRGHHLGRVIWEGSAEPDTGQPGNVNGKVGDRVLRAPVDGAVTQVVVVGEYVQAGAIIARVADQPIIAPFDGVLRGLVDNDTVVRAGLKIGDLDPRAKREYCFTISDKSLAIGGGAVEAVLSAPQLQGVLHRSKLDAR